MNSYELSLINLSQVLNMTYQAMDQREKNEPQEKENDHEHDITKSQVGEFQRNTQL